MKKVILKPGKEKAIKNRHHWIFSGAIAKLPSFENGEFLQVYSFQDQFLGWGYFNQLSDITGRMLCFDETPPLEMMEQRLKAAFALRSQFFQDNRTTAYRLVNGEGDLLPGIVIDKYKDILVLQISTLGMDRLRSWLIDFLKTHLKPTAIYEKSELPSRKEEGLTPFTGLLYGIDQDLIEIQENDLKFYLSLKEGQKTGFFLDHREMRARIKTLSANKRVLNCFAYTGGFSVYAAAGGASQVDSVEISASALDLATKNMQLNGFNSQSNFFKEDVFQFLRNRPLDYDLVILDPPAFAKRKKDIIPACRGYKDINRITIQKMAKSSLLLTSSCSYYVNQELFQKVIFQAAVEAQREVRIIGHHQMAIDHPINICHPEGDYLKSLLLYIE